MIGSPNDYMKVGVLHFMAFPQCACGEGPILQTVSAIAVDPFFDVVEVSQMTSPLVRQEVRAIIEESRIEAHFGAQPVTLSNRLDLNHPDESERRHAVQAVQWGIEQARELGCRSVAVLSGHVSDDRETAKARLVNSLKQLCAYAAARGLRILLETFDQAPFGKNCLLGPTGEAVELSQEMRRSYPDFGLILDLSHLPLLGESAADAVAAAGDHLAHVHIGNCAMDNPDHPAYGDNHPRFGLAGTRNDIPELVEFLRVLMDAGYLAMDQRKVVSFEVKPQAGENAEAVLAGSKRTLLEAWRRL